MKRSQARCSGPGHIKQTHAVSKYIEYMINKIEQAYGKQLRARRWVRTHQTITCKEQIHWTHDIEYNIKQMKAVKSKAMDHDTSITCKQRIYWIHDIHFATDVQKELGGPGHIKLKNEVVFFEEDHTESIIRRNESAGSVLLCVFTDLECEPCINYSCECLHITHTEVMMSITYPESESARFVISHNRKRNFNESAHQLHSASESAHATLCF